MLADELNQGLGQLLIQLLRGPGDAEGGCKRRVFSGPNLLGKHVDTNLIFLKVRDRKQNGTLPQKGHEFSKHEGPSTGTFD